MSTELDDVRERLESISDQLADLAMDRLRRALDDGATGRPADERRITRARRAVDKAVELLREPVDDDGDGE